MPQVISSPPHSFVDFNDPVLYCGSEAPFPLPAPAGAGFQVNITDAVSDPDAYWLGVCDADCNILNRYNITASGLCYNYGWENVYGGAASWPTEDKYPVLANTCYGYDEFLSDVPYSYATEADLMAAVSDAIGVTITSWDDFENCCPLRLNLCLLLYDVDNTFYANNLEQSVSTLGFFTETLDITPYVDNGNCFRYCVLYYTGEGDVENLGCSQLFVRDDSDCYSTTLKYYGDDNQFGFVYRNSFYNMVRIPMYLRKPIFPTEERVYRTSAGTYRRQSALVEKEWDVWTEYLPEWMHQRLVIALKHDHVLVTSPDADLTAIELTQQGDYSIEWQEKEDIYAPASYKIRQPVDGMNRNCNTQSLCCIPGAIAFDYTDPEAGTGDIYFGIGANATAVQLRIKYPGETEWVNTGQEAPTSPISVAGVPITQCSNEYYELQLRSVCGSNYSAWSSSVIVRHPLACGYPEIQSISMLHMVITRFSIFLANNENVINYTYDILNDSAVSVGSGTTPDNVIYSNFIAGAVTSPYTFTITANCVGGGQCTVTGTIVFTNKVVDQWTVTQV